MSARKIFSGMNIVLENSAKSNSNKESMSEIEYVVCGVCGQKIEAFYTSYSGKVVTQHCFKCNNEVKFINPKKRVFFSIVQQVKKFEYKNKEEIKVFGIITMSEDLESLHQMGDAFN